MHIATLLICIYFKDHTLLYVYELSMLKTRIFTQDIARIHEKQIPILSFSKIVISQAGKANTYLYMIFRTRYLAFILIYMIEFYVKNCLLGHGYSLGVAFKYFFK